MKPSLTPSVQMEARTTTLINVVRSLKEEDFVKCCCTPGPWSRESARNSRLVAVIWKGGSPQRMSVRELVKVKITRPPHGSVHWGHTSVQLALTKFTIPQNKITLGSFIYYISKCVYFKRFLKEITTDFWLFFLEYVTKSFVSKKCIFALLSSQLLQ